MKEHLSLLAQLISAYKNEIPFAADMRKDLDALLGQEINFKVILDFFVKYPFVNFIPYFKLIHSSDLAAIKEVVNNIIKASQSMLLQDAETMRPDEIFSLLYTTLPDSLTKDESTFPQEDKEKFVKLCKQHRPDLWLSLINDTARILLITGSYTITPEFHYAKMGDQPLQNMPDLTCMRMAEYNAFFIDLSTKEMINHFKSRSDFILVETDKCVQYQLHDEVYYHLQPPPARYPTSQWQHVQKAIKAIEPNFLAYDMTKCHMIYIHDIKTDRFWVMHVTPNCMTDGAFMGNKRPYEDLAQNYSDKSLGTDDTAELEVVVVSKGRYFDESLFREKMPAKIKSLKVINPNIAMDLVIFRADEDKYKYVIYFNPYKNLIALQQHDTYIEYTDVFTRTLPISHFGGEKESIFPGQTLLFSNSGLSSDQAMSSTRTARIAHDFPGAKSEIDTHSTKISR